MKKLLKKSLNELAQVMPVISEEVRKACVGGTVYVGTCGGRIGAIGSGTEIVVLSNDEAGYFNNAQYAYNNGSNSFTITGDEGSTTFNLNNYGESLRNASADVKLNVFEQYATEYCPGKPVNLNASGSIIAKANISSNRNDDSLSFNPNNSFNFDERDLKSILVHEQYHFDNYDENFSNTQMEIDSISNESTSNEFKNSSLDYQANQAAYYKMQYNIEHPNNQIAMRDACNALGVTYQSGMID